MKKPSPRLMKGCATRRQDESCQQKKSASSCENGSPVKNLPTSGARLVEKQVSRGRELMAKNRDIFRALAK